MSTVPDTSEMKALQIEVAYYMRRLYKRGLTTTFGGNISLKAKDLYFVTASQTDKGRMKASDICILDRDGRQIGDILKQSMETEMHLAIYSVRPDIKAVVHAHPPLSSSFAVSHQSINTKLTAEAWAVLGELAMAEYALMGTKNLAEVVANAARQADVVLMKNHGVLAVGQTLAEAFDRIEVLENAAKIHLLSQWSGSQKSLSPAETIAINQMLKP